MLTSRAKSAIYFVGRRATYEAGADQWDRVLRVIGQYRADLGASVVQGWYNALCKYGLCIRAVGDEGSNDNNIGVIMFARVKRALHRLNTNAAAAARITGFLLRHVETSEKAMHQILTSSDEDFTVTVKALVTKLV